MPRKPLTPEAAKEAIRRASMMSDVAKPPVVFSGKKQLFFEARLAGATVQEACALAGYSKSNAHRVSHYPDFAEALQAARAERIMVAQETVADLVPLAIRRLGDILRDPLAKNPDVVAAAREVLDRGGMPKTEKIDLSGTIAAATFDNIDQLAEEVRHGAAILDVIEDGRK